MKERVPWFVVENPFVVIYLFELIDEFVDGILLAQGSASPQHLMVFITELSLRLISERREGDLRERVERQGRVGGVRRTSSTTWTRTRAGTSRSLSSWTASSTPRARPPRMQLMMFQYHLYERTHTR